METARTWKSSYHNIAVIGSPSPARSPLRVWRSHHHIENNEVGRAALEKTSERHRILRGADAEALLGKVLSDQIPNVAVVVHDGDVLCSFHERPKAQIRQLASSKRPAAPVPTSGGNVGFVHARQGVKRRYTGTMPRTTLAPAIRGATHGNLRTL